MTLGEKIKQLRTAKGWTQGQLAVELGLTKAAVCRYEADQRVPDYKTLGILSALFDVSYDDLLITEGDDYGTGAGDDGEQ